MQQSNHRRHVLLRQDKPATEITYDNSSSGLAADTVQEAIDEVAGDVAAIQAYPPQLGYAGVQ